MNFLAMCLGNKFLNFSPDGTTTGAAQTGLTTPTYTLSADVAPNSHSKQYAVTALGGTQTDVRAHSASDPFTVTFERPANFKLVGQPNPVTGVLGNVQRNVFTYRVRKGVRPMTDQAPQLMLMELKISIPAGADVADAANIRAALSNFIGTLNEESSDIGDALITGVI